MLANELSLLDYVILSFLLMDCNCHVQVVHFGRVLSRMTESLLYNPLDISYIPLVIFIIMIV